MRVLLAAAVLFAAPSAASAQSYSICNADADPYSTGITEYRYIQYQADDDLITEQWGCDFYRWKDWILYVTRFDSSWDHPNWSFDEACDNRKPTGRHLDAIVFLTIGMGWGSAPQHKQDMSGTIGEWASVFVGMRSDEYETEVSCWHADETGSGTPAHARSERNFFAAPFYDDHIMLHFPYFYDMSPALRAGTLIHETRHATCGHYKDDNACKGGGSCDFKWNNGCVHTKKCDSIGDSDSDCPSNTWGSNQLEVAYLIDIGRNSHVVTNYTRGGLLDSVNAALDKHFVHDPCFRVNKKWDTYRTCPIQVAEVAVAELDDIVAEGILSAL